VLDSSNYDYDGDTHGTEEDVDSSNGDGDDSRNGDLFGPGGTGAEITSSPWRRVKMTACPIKSL
jgi:hypothetical protein